MKTTVKNVQISSFWANLFKTPTEQNDLEEVLLSMPIFKTCTSKQIKSCMALIHNRAYQTNEYIFHQGDPGIGLYFIQEGKVIVSQAFEKKGSLDLVTFQRGDFFGELALIDEHPRSASAIALTDCNLAVVFKPDLDDFVENHSAVGLNILRGISEIIATRLRVINNDYLKLYFKQQEERK